MASNNKKLYKELNKTGYSLKDGFLQIGFLIPSLDPNQLAYTCITNCNQWLNENFGTSFAIFYDKNYLPCVDPIFPRYHMANAFGFEGNLVATSIETALNIKTAVKSRRYYYIYDLDWLRNGYSFTKEQTESVLKNPDIVKFTRSEEYIKEIEKAGCTSLHGVVEDFDINKILEIINDKR